MISSCFPVTTVETIAGLDDGSIAIGPFGSSMKASLYTATGVPVVRGNNIGSGRKLVGDYVYVAQETADRLKRSLLKEGDLFFPHRGAIGEVGIVTPSDPQPLLMSTSLMRLRVNTAIADPDFVFWFFKSAMGKDEILQFASTVGTPGIGQPLTSLRAMTMPLPPLTEQREIASILGALDDKIELNRRMAATLEEMARALYRSWFVDFDPVKAKADGQVPAFMDEETATLFPNRFGDDGIPEGWEMRRLVDILTLNYGKALKKDLRQPGPYPVYGSGGTDSSHVDPLVASATVVVGRKGTVGSIYWSPRGCWPIDTTYYVSTSYPMVYALHILRNLPLSEMNTDAAVPGLNRENAYRLKVTFPGAEVIRVFSERVGSIQERIDSIDQEITTLATLRDTLLPKLMSGELRVGEAKEQIEEVA